MDVNGKTVLVTGADGFIGSHLVEQLVSRGATVRALACYNSFNSWGWLDHIDLGGNPSVVAGDIRDRDFCRGILEDIEVVFNLAALIGIPYSYSAPQSYIDTNVMGTLNICQSARETGVKRLIQVSTSEVYGTAQYVPIDEKHPLQPMSPYSASKIAADAVAMSYFYSFELPVVLARPFNTYGPRQSARAVIPTIISQAASGRKEIHLGDTSPTRDFNYVGDTCRGMILLAQCEDAVGQTVNIGSNTETSIQAVAEMIVAQMGLNVAVVHDRDRMRPSGSEVRRLVCDNSKIRRLTGYQPIVDLERGIRQTVEWFTEPGNLSRYKAGTYNV